MWIIVPDVIGRINASQYKINYFHTCADIGTTQLPRHIAAIRLPAEYTTVLATYTPVFKTRILLLRLVEMPTICGRCLEFV